MLSRKRGNFISGKTNFAAVCGQSGEKFNAAWNKISRLEASNEILDKF
jgi:hypothetical protein